MNTTKGKPIPQTRRNSRNNAEKEDKPNKLFKEHGEPEEKEDPTEEKSKKKRKVESNHINKQYFMATNNESKLTSTKKLSTSKK